MQMRPRRHYVWLSRSTAPRPLPFEGGFFGRVGRVTNPRADERLKILVYSDDADTRSQVMLGLGRRPHPDLPEVEYVEVATEPVVLQQMDSGRIDLAILDGEAVPAGGMGIAKQMKDEVYRCPPILVLTGRPQDAWLATWSRADGAVSHPIDPLQLAETVLRLLRGALEPVETPAVGR
jgi:DNA-binding response OmpR family regulator